MVKRKYKSEIYNLDASPLSQTPTQRQLAELVRYSRDDLRRLANYKEYFIKRELREIRGKDRNLVYPTGKLRGVHERLKHYLNRVRQPDFVMSPRKGRSQRDNAEAHIGSHEFLTLDIK